MTEWADWEQWLAEWHARRSGVCLGEATWTPHPSPEKMAGIDEYRGYSRESVNAITPQRDYTTI